MISLNANTPSLAWEAKWEGRDILPVCIISLGISYGLPVRQSETPAVLCCSGNWSSKHLYRQTWARSVQTEHECATACSWSLDVVTKLCFVQYGILTNVSSVHCIRSLESLYGLVVFFLNAVKLIYLQNQKHLFFLSAAAMLFCCADCAIVLLTQC